jgi:uncharacterized membrane protein YhaH (DUF805 family)
MSFSDAVRACFNKFATFEGRASRSEFWWFYVFTLIVGIIVDIATHATDSSVVTVVGALVSLAIVIPSLAVASRRLHDIGRSGWWQLLTITIIGSLVLIYWWAQPSERGSNAFGNAPA